MAQVAVGDISTGSADANQTDVTHIVASGEILLVGVLIEVTDAGKEVSSVTWDQGGGDQASLSQFTAFNPSSGKLRCEVWRITNPVAKTATVRVTIAGGNSQKTGVVCVSLSNVDTGTPLKNAATQDGTGSSGNVSVNQNADDLAFVFAGHFKTDALAPASSEDEHADFEVEGSFRMWAASEDGSSATTLSWSDTESAERATVGFAISAATVGRRGEISWAEFEVPDAPRRGEVSWAELEVPNAPRRGGVSWAELEVPNAPRRGEVSWTEFEVPNAPRRGEISWAEFEVPAFDRRGGVSWSEFEVPNAPRRGEISWTEFEVPAVGRRGEVSWAELEVPDGPRRGEISWAEFEIPTAPRRGEVSWAEFQVPNAPRRAEISWAEFEVPLLDARGEVSWAEFEVPNAPISDRLAEVSWVEFEVPFIDARGEISWIEFEVPQPPRRAEISSVEFEVPVLVSTSEPKEERKISVPQGAVTAACIEALRKLLVGRRATDTISFYGVAPVTQTTIAAAGTDAGTTQTLANDLRTKLIALGLVKA